MATLVAATFLSVDGVMQAPGHPDEDRSGGFEHGGRPVPLVDAEGMEPIADSISRADAFLLGRRTYELFAAHCRTSAAGTSTTAWPSP